MRMLSGTGNYNGMRIRKQLVFCRGYGTAYLVVMNVAFTVGEKALHSFLTKITKAAFKKRIYFLQSYYEAAAKMMQYVQGFTAAS